MPMFYVCAVIIAYPLGIIRGLTGISRLAQCFLYKVLSLLQSRNIYYSKQILKQNIKNHNS